MNAKKLIVAGLLTVAAGLATAAPKQQWSPLIDRANNGAIANSCQVILIQARGTGNLSPEGFMMVNDAANKFIQIYGQESVKMSQARDDRGSQLATSAYYNARNQIDNLSAQQRTPELMRAASQCIGLL